MTVTLNLPPAIEQAILAEAQAKGVSLDALVQDKLIAVQPWLPDPNALPLDEWVRHFEALLASNAGNTVVLADDAMERESIYGDHGR